MCVNIRVMLVTVSMIEELEFSRNCLVPFNIRLYVENAPLTSSKTKNETERKQVKSKTKRNENVIILAKTKLNEINENKNEIVKNKTKRNETSLGLGFRV